MALEYILPAINTHLIDSVSMLSANNCSIEPDGRPPAVAADFHVTIDEAGVTIGGDPNNEHLDFVHDVLIRLNVRMGQYASDRTEGPYIRTGWLKNLASFVAPELAIVQALHGNHRVRLLAVELAVGSGYNFASPLYYLGRGRTQKHDPSWDGALSGGGINDDMAWLSRELRFRGFQTYQKLRQVTGPG